MTYESRTAGGRWTISAPLTGGARLMVEGAQKVAENHAGPGRWKAVGVPQYEVELDLAQQLQVEYNKLGASVTPSARKILANEIAEGRHLPSCM
jgi:hypothetical protein